MFRSLTTVSPEGGATKTIMQPPLSATLVAENGAKLEPVELALEADGIFSTSVGSSTKKTLANWHVTSPAEVVEAMLELVNVNVDVDATVNVEAAAEVEVEVEGSKL